MDNLFRINFKENNDIMKIDISGAKNAFYH